MPLPRLQPRAVPRILRSGTIPIARPRAPLSWRTLSTTRALLARHDISKARNHYETLNVAYDASPADIKKSFYSLSKSYHPDHNPDDASATTKFHSIADAYAVLGTPAKRAAYDRDVIRQQHPGPGHTAARRGSYHSSGPAGGRPASGLSRRKTQFRGPPPSFHRSGGWGAHAHKRGAAHDESTGSQGSPSGHTHEAPHPEATARGAGWSAGQKPGMGIGQDPFGYTLESDLPHFDTKRHTMSQQEQDRRRTARILRETGAQGAASDSTFSGFLAVSGVLVLAIFLPFVFFGGLSQGKGKKAKPAT
ncbi:DnaJ domain-containing protein [Plectosphaerella cucumerina]|uniref:DnaJ domain-containing protein n=1 Tax=Plectosphaerella cucumerina TaxID=40658 RepID=A0A8K0TBC9_9PEZI|nr:DnaJ domain-containing protein [Plectosphaerella cucumerina]